MNATYHRAVGVEIAVRGARRGPPRPRKSPFTGAVETYAELEMTDEEYRAASAVLARYGRIDEYGEGRLTLPAGEVEVWGFDYDGGMMNLIGDLRGGCDLVFELASAARLVVQFEAPHGEACALVTTPEALALTDALDEAAHEELGLIALVADPDALWRTLARPDAPPRGLA